MKIRFVDFGNGWKKSLWRRMMKRFGGGWDFKLGFAYGKGSILIHVGIGTIRIDF